jgi:Lipase (class 3)
MGGTIDVQGGAGSIAADCEDMLASAALIGSVAARIGEDAVAMHGCLLGIDLVESALVDPAGAARFEAALIAALDGPSGVTALAARCGGLDIAVRAAASSYLAVDHLADAMSPYLGALPGLPQALGHANVNLLEARPLTSLQRLVTADPDLVDVLVATVAEGDPAGAFASLGALYSDGHPIVRSNGVDAAADAAGPPRDLPGLLTGLSRRNDGADGEIDVRVLAGTDQSGRPYRRVVVDIPGTKDWSIANLEDHDVTNLGTNLRAMAGQTTTYERGVIAAMRAAGVRAGDDVTLVGHSQGGVIAVSAARDLTHSGEFTVSHVVTAGAPISGVVAALPRSVQVLAIENRGDVVPHLDGGVNPDRGNVTTVTVHHNRDDVLANHDLNQSYLPGAADVQASDDASVRAFLNGMRPVFGATTVATHAYVVTRRP